MKQFNFKTLGLLFLLPLLTITQEAISQKFKASVVKVDITPDRPQNLLGYQARVSTGVHDKIYHRVVVLHDGKAPFILVSSDICVVSPSEYDRVAEMVSKRFKIPAVNFWWTVTHTHSAPEVGPPGLPEVFMGERYTHQYDKAYTAEVEEKLLDAIDKGLKQLEPARLGVGWGYSQANINRRARSVDGKTSLGMNPDGPVDRKIGLLRIEREDKTPIALLANYAMHGTVLGGANLHISGDGPGIVAEYVEEQIGAPMLYINGAAGNLAPIYSVYPSPGAAQIHQFKVLLGDKIIAANKNILATTDEVKLKSGGIVVETPRKEGMNWTSDLANYSRALSNGTHVVKLPVRFLKINEDIAIWSAPLELFCEISNEIRDRSPFPYTFYYGYGNGWLGYLLTEEEWKYGGYEPTVSPYTPRAAKDLTEGVLNYIQGVMRSK
jgi:neutral ceramidase